MMRIASFLAVLLLTTTAYSAEQPNVLFIAVDDLRPELGCYGNKHIQSPHIDALAQHSVLFSRAYCQQAVCNPSRASLLTGLRPDSSKVWDLVTHFRDTVPDVVTLPQHFRQHGYAAVAYGKIYHNPLPDKSSWDEPNHWPKKARAWSAGSVQRLQAYREKMRAAGKSETAIRRMRAPAIEDADVPDNTRPDGEIADQAITAMQKLAANDKPFFLAVGFVKPHLPFNAPRRYWDLYDPAKIPLADNPQLPDGGPAMAMNTMYELRDYMDFANTSRPDQGALSEAQQRRLKHGYYAAVSYSDAQVGRLMAELDRLKLRKNTVVVLWGDHGWKLGEHRSWCKQTNYEIDTRVPLMISTPGDDRQNASCKSIVEFVDVYPTLCELAGLPAPEHLQGTSLLPLLSNPDKQGKNIAVSQFPRRHAGGESMGYAVRTSRYRYVEWLDRSTCKTTAVELFDHQHDPQENTNIAKEPAQKAKLAELSAALWKHIPRPQPGDIARPPRKRPVIRFKNLRSKPVELFWIGPNGRVSRGHIKPGNTRSIKTTKFHQFQFEGGKPITVRKPDQTIAIQEKPDTASAKEKLEADYWLKVWLNPQSQKAERSAIEMLSGTSYLHYHIKVGPEVDALLLKRGINYTHWESRLAAIRAFQATFQGSTPYPGQKRPVKVDVNPILRIYQDGMNDPHPKVRAATMEALADMAAYLDESTVNGIFNPQKFIEADPYLDTIVDLAITKGIVDANTKVADAAHHTILMAGSPRKYWLRSLRRVVDQKLIKTTDYHKRAKEMLVEWERDVANIKPPPPPKTILATPNPFAEPDPPVRKPAPEPEDSPFG